MTEFFEENESSAAKQLKGYWAKAKDKYATFMEDVKHDPKLAGAVHLARAHRKETFFIVLMGIGILLSFLHSLGGFLVGAVSMLCLPWDIAWVWKNIAQFYDEKGQFKTVILGMVGLFLLLKVPSLLIGSFLGLSLNLFLQNDVTRPTKEGLKESAKEISEHFHSSDEQE